MLESWELFLGIVPELFLKLGVAAICGILLGIEREQRDKPAGLRTILLITVGSALFAIVGELIGIVTAGTSAIINVDTSRVASQVVSGIGFLGAGSIIQARGSVRGLTTAAVIWTAAAIGLCAGVGFPILAVGVTVFVVIILNLLVPLRTWLSRKGHRREITVRVPNDSLVLRMFWDIIEDNDIPDKNIRFDQEEAEGVYEVTVTYHTLGTSMPGLVEGLSQIKEVRGVSLSLDEARARNRQSIFER